MGAIHRRNGWAGVVPEPAERRPGRVNAPDLGAHHPRHDSGSAEHEDPARAARGVDISLIAPPASNDPGAIARGRYRTIHRQLDPLARNERLAQANRAWLAHRGVVLIHLVGSSRAGKTTLVDALVDGRSEGSRTTPLDAGPVSRAAARRLQLDPCSTDPLDAMTVARGLLQLSPPRGSTVMVESRANLPGRRWLDLGEHATVIIMSVTDGDDTPLKYGAALRAAGMLVVNKIDLLPYVEFDVQRCMSLARSFAPDLPIVCVSARKGDGVGAVAAW